METAVRKATRLDYNPPKQKHVTTLVSLTFHNPACINEMLELLERRHRENSWIMSFKVLVILHILMRQGNADRTIAYVEGHPACLDTTRLREKSSGVIHIQNIYLYTNYLQEKVTAYRELHMDYIKSTISSKVGRLRRLSVNDGLLKETKVLQKQVSALLKCKFILDDVDNTISVFAFKLVVEDLLILFQVINEGVVNILEQYFALTKADALTSLAIYRRFAKQTEEVTEFLNCARQFQQEMHIAIPTVKHAPTSLIPALEEYLNDLDDKTSPQQKDSTEHAVNTSSATSASIQPAPEQPEKLIDFFSSLEPSTISTPQPSLHNPFRNTVLSSFDLQPSNSHITHTSQLNQLQQQSCILNTPQQQLQFPSSSPLPTNANPFRTGTVEQPPTSSFPALSPLSSPYQQSTLFQQPGYLQQQSSMSTGGINLVSTTSTATSSNPFVQQQQSFFQAPQFTGMNPFSMAVGSQQQQQQQNQQ